MTARIFLAAFLVATPMLNACIHRRPNGGASRERIEQGKIAPDLELRKWRRVKNIWPLTTPCIRYLYDRKGAWRSLCMIPAVPIDFVFGWRIITFEGYFRKGQPKSSDER